MALPVFTYKNDPSVSWLRWVLHVDGQPTKYRVDPPSNTGPCWVWVPNAKGEPVHVGIFNRVAGAQKICEAFYLADLYRKEHADAQ